MYTAWLEAAATKLLGPRLRGSLAAVRGRGAPGCIRDEVVRLYYIAFFSA